MNEEDNKIENLNKADELVKRVFEEIITEIEKSVKDTVWFYLFKQCLLILYVLKRIKNIMSNM